MENGLFELAATSRRLKITALLLFSLRGHVFWVNIGYDRGPNPGIEKPVS
jgi:hypothetical protein